jgi:hypothetical protein
VNNEKMGNIPNLLLMEQRENDKDVREWGIELGELCNHHD